MTTAKLNELHSYQEYDDNKELEEQNRIEDKTDKKEDCEFGNSSDFSHYRWGAV